MRCIALVPVLLCTASFVLAFLCLFAGSRRGWMEDYAVFTLDTSRIGQNVLDTNRFSDRFIGTYLDKVPDSVRSELKDGIASMAERLGVREWYSYHLMNYCEGYYELGYTGRRSDVNRYTTYCSKRRGMYEFDPQEILQRALDESGTGFDLSDLRWPDSIQTGLDALRIAAQAAFVLYCIAIAFIGIALFAAVVSFFFHGRLSALINVIIDWLAFVVFGIASSVATAVAVKASDVINEYGDQVGVSANRGSKFLIITWVGTGLLLVASIVWCFDCIVGGRRRARSVGPKHG